MYALMKNKQEVKILRMDKKYLDLQRSGMFG
jgi:hypothetical protein